MRKYQEDTMSNLIRKAKKVIMIVGLFGIMLSLAGALAGAPAASASSLDSAIGASTVSEVSQVSVLNSEPNGKIGVYAINSIDGSRVAGAEVVVIDQSSITVAKGVTTADGFFSASLPPGVYKATITAKGFFRARQVTEVKSSEVSILKINILP